MAVLLLQLPLALAHRAGQFEKKALLDACADSNMEVTHGKYGSVLVAAAALSSIKTIECGSLTLVRM
jgi:hypothetical protein